MTPLESQAANHLLNLILKCDHSQATNANTLVDAYRAFAFATRLQAAETASYLCDPAKTPHDANEAPTACFGDTVPEPLVPTEDGVNMTVQPTETPAPAKRTRRSKEQIAADEAAAKAAQSETPELETEPPAEAPESAPEPELPAGEVPADPEAVKQQIREVFGKVKNKEGAKEELAKILKKHNAANITLLKPEQVNAVLATVLAL